MGGVGQKGEAGFMQFSCDGPVRRQRQRRQGLSLSGVADSQAA